MIEIVGKSIYLEDYEMKQHCIDEKTGISYTLQGDYYLPDFAALPTEKETVIGILGQRHLRFIKQHKRVFYANLLTSCKLNSYLADIDEQAENLFSRLMVQMAEREGITEQLKAIDQMAWNGAMNNIRNRATEVVNTELIYTV